MWLLISSEFSKATDECVVQLELNTLTYKIEMHAGQKVGFKKNVLHVHLFKYDFLNLNIVWLGTERIKRSFQ